MFNPSHITTHHTPLLYLFLLLRRLLLLSQVDVRYAADDEVEEGLQRTPRHIRATARVGRASKAKTPARQQSGGGSRSSGRAKTTTKSTKKTRKDRKCPQGGWVDGWVVGILLIVECYRSLYLYDTTERLLSHLLFPSFSATPSLIKDMPSHSTQRRVVVGRATAACEASSMAQM